MNRIAKLDRLQESGSIDAFLLSTEPSVKYFSGFSFYFEHGISPYQAIPALLAVVPGEVSALILADNESGGSLEDFGLVKDALQAGIDAVRPDARACDIDRIMRKITGEYGHHSGHGIGTAYHEHPWIVPYEQMELKPDMVIALEPAVYKEGYGIRLEHLVRVTDGGAELLTHFRHHF